MGDVLTKDEHHEILTDAIMATDPMGAEIAARKIDMRVLLERDAALARAEKAEMERDAAETQIADCERWKAQAGIEKARATAAEAREAKLREVLVRMDESCWQAWKAFAEEGPRQAEAFLRFVCVDEGIMDEKGRRNIRPALAAEEVQP